MEIKVTPKEALAPGDTVYLREFGSKPFVLVQPTQDILVKSYQPDPTTKHRNSWTLETHLIEHAWIVRDKRNNFLTFPAAALTKVRPPTTGDRITAGLLIASCFGLVTAPMWLFELARLF